MSSKSKLISSLMWLLPLSFFTYQFVLRLWPSLMMHEIMQQFAIDATAFGLLASVYYYGYAGMQIPIAMLLDRYGARLIVCLSAIVCGLATLLFTYTDNWYLCLLSRFLVGAGSAVGFLGTSKVISQWFSHDAYAKMIGYSFTVGLMGAIYGGKPVSLLVEASGWQSVAVTLACVSLAIGLFTFAFLRTPKKPLVQQTEEPFTFGDFKNILSSPSLWLLAIANLLMVGSLEGFADVWGVNFLMTAYSMSKSDAAQLVSCIFVGMLFGGPILAGFAKKWDNFRVIRFAGIGMAGAFCLLTFMPTLFNWYTLALLFFAVGILCCYQVIVFATGSTLVKSHLLGVTVAFLNCINMLGGSFFHTLIGSFMDLFWDGTHEGAVRHYSLDAYQHALLVIPVSALAGALLINLVKSQVTKRAF